MGGLSLMHWLIVAIVVMLLFGRGKISDLMGDVAKGIKSFKKGMAEDDAPVTAKPLDHQPASPVSATNETPVKPGLGT
jgi:sec-independent protein translocase protein TatA